MAFWKKWTQEVWFGPRESDDEDVGPVQQPSAQQPKKKKKKKKSKPKKQQTETNQVESTSI